MRADSMSVQCPATTPACDYVQPAAWWDPCMSALAGWCPDHGMFFHAPLLGETWLDDETDQDVAALAKLEAEFEAAGGRGVDLAERIDTLRARIDDNRPTWSR